MKACFDTKILASYATIRIPIPKQSANAYTEIMQKNPQNETAEYDSNKKMVEWQIKRLQGGSEKTLKVKYSIRIDKNYIASHTECSYSEKGNRSSADAI